MVNHSMISLLEAMWVWWCHAGDGVSLTFSHSLSLPPPCTISLISFLSHLSLPLPFPSLPPHSQHPEGPEYAEVSIKPSAKPRATKPAKGDDMQQLTILMQFIRKCQSHVLLSLMHNPCSDYWSFLKTISMVFWVCCFCYRDSQ